MRMRAVKKLCICALIAPQGSNTWTMCLVLTQWLYRHAGSPVANRESTATILHMLCNLEG